MQRHVTFEIQGPAPVADALGRLEPVPDGGKARQSLEKRTRLRGSTLAGDMRQGDPGAAMDLGQCASAFVDQIFTPPLTPSGEWPPLSDANVEPVGINPHDLGTGNPWQALEPEAYTFGIEARERVSPAEVERLEDVAVGRLAMATQDNLVNAETCQAQRLIDECGNGRCHRVGLR